MNEKYDPVEFVAQPLAFPGQPGKYIRIPRHLEGVHPGNDYRFTMVPSRPPKPEPLGTVYIAPRPGVRLSFPKPVGFWMEIECGALPSLWARFWQRFLFGWRWEVLSDD